MKPGIITRNRSDGGRSSLAPVPLLGGARGGFQRNGFTLIEIMIVVAIIGLVAMIGIPAIYHAFHPESLQKGVADMQDACNSARARAIAQSAPVDLHFQPRTGKYEVVDAPRDVAPVEEALLTSNAQNPPSAPVNTGAVTSTNLSGQLSDHIRVNMFELNFHDFKEADDARIRFYANGTCDECTIVLQSMDTGESKKLTLDLVTALLDVGPFP